MKVKLTTDIAAGDFGAAEAIPAGSVLEVDEATGAEMIAAGVAEVYSEEVVVEEGKAIEKEVKKMKENEEKVEVKVTKDAPLWKSAGEFLGAVKNAARGKYDERLYKSTGQNETTNADGGFLVTTDIGTTIMQQVQGNSVLAPKCSTMEIGNLYTGIKIPQVNESTRSQTTLYGGVRCYAPAEGVAKTAFKQAYTQKQIDLKKLCAVNYVTDELLQDNTALESFIRMNVGKALAWTLDNDIINGTLSVCTALVNHAATVEVTVAGNNPTAVEIGQMYAQNLNRDRAEWFMTGAQYAAIIALVNAGNFSIFAPDYTKSPAGTLLGRPINVIEQGGAVDAESSFMFLDLSDYLLIKKGGVQEATSIHVKFLEDETAFRWVMRIGGAPLQASTVTLPDGVAYSSFVTRD